MEIDKKKIVILTINVNYVNKPIKFKGEEYIRSGSSIDRLSMFPEKERAIWLSFESSKFELETSKINLTFKDVENLLDIEFYESKRKYDEFSNVIDAMVFDHIIERVGSNFNITNLGAYTLGRNMKDFPNLSSRTLRILRHDGSKSVDPVIYDYNDTVGIANGFRNIISIVMSLIGHYEDYTKGIRMDKLLFPQISIRELIANALVHQDFTNSGQRPTVEIFNNKVEI